MASLSPSPKMQFFTANGIPLAGGKLYTYVAGGLTVPQATYTDSTGGTPNTNPIILDSRGEASVWLADGLMYALKLTDSLDSLIWTSDNISGQLTTTSFHAASSKTTTTSLDELPILDSAASFSLKKITAGNLLSVSQTVPVAVPYLQTLSDIVAGNEISIFRFIPSSKHAGIRAGTDTSDLLTSFQQAAAAAKSIFMPYGTYYVSGTTNISKDGSKWRGEGISGTVIVSTVNNLPILSINGGLNGVTLENFQLSRNITAIAGGDGIVSNTVSIGQALLHRLLIQNQNNGLNLGPTDYSMLSDIICSKNTAIGIRLANTATDGAVQWSMNNVLSQMNGAQGVLVQSVTGVAQMTLGTFRGINTFANSGTGLAFAGLVGTPIQGVRIIGGFIGEDGNSSLYMDTFGGQHMIEGVFSELAGTRTTGPALATAASHIGSGFEVTGNNVGTQFIGCHSNGNSYDGFYTAGIEDQFIGCRATNNGVIGTVGRQAGFNNASGIAIVSGCRSGNTGAGTTQQYGVFGADGNNLSVVCCDLRSNTTAPLSATASPTYISQIANLPNTINTIIPAGGVQVGGGATGGASIAGGINVAGGLAKNNTAYTNP